MNAPATSPSTDNKKRGFFSQPERASLSIAASVWMIFLVEIIVTRFVHPSPNNFPYYFTIGLILILSIIVLLPMSIYQAIKALSKGIGSPVGPVIALVISAPPLLAFIVAFIYAVFFKGRL